MNTLLSLYQSDIDPSLIAPVVYVPRETARAVLINRQGSIALLHSTANNFHTLPGGGLFDGEPRRRALKREVDEETGSAVEILKKLGVVVEFRDYSAMEQTSHCYLAKTIGEPQTRSLTTSEQMENYEVVWASDIDDAIRLVQSSDQETPQRKFMVAREPVILEAACQAIEELDL